MGEGVVTANGNLRGRIVNVRAKFAWYDLWVGAFIERNHPDYRTVIYVCPLPMLVFVFNFGRLS